MSAIVSVLLVILAVIVGALVIAAIWGVGIYNSLVALRNACKNAFAQVDVQLKRRYDLIPNLVETAAELDFAALARFGTVGVTAGASTPAFLIDEVCLQLEKAA
jgi:hypothetical protein